MYMMSSGLVGRGLSLRIPEVFPASVASETSGIRNLRPHPTSLEDTIHIDAGRESLNQNVEEIVYHILCQCPLFCKQTINCIQWERILQFFSIKENFFTL